MVRRAEAISADRAPQPLPATSSAPVTAATWLRAVVAAKLTRGERALARVLAADPGFPERPPLRVLAERLDGLSVAQTRRRLRGLERAGLITRDTAPSTPTTYAALRKRRGAAWRTLVLCADALACVDCGATTDLDAHHIVPRSAAPARTYDVANGITLCRACHVAVTGREADHAPRFARIVETRRG